MLKLERHDYDETVSTVTTQLGQVVTDICKKSPIPLILDTGRTAEVGGLLTGLSQLEMTNSRI